MSKTNFPGNKVGNLSVASDILPLLIEWHIEFYRFRRGLIGRSEFLRPVALAAPLRVANDPVAGHVMP